MKAINKIMVIFCTFFIFTLSFGTAIAASLNWGSSFGADGYTIYYTDGVVTQPWSEQTTETSIDLSLLNLTPGTYTFYVTAYNSVGESGSSNTVEYIMDSYSPPNNLKPVTIVIPGPVTITVN